MYPLFCSISIKFFKQDLPPRQGSPQHRSTSGLRPHLQLRRHTSEVSSPEGVTNRKEPSGHMRLIHIFKCCTRVPFNTALNTHKADAQYLVVHAVHSIWPQQIDGLTNEVCASTVEHSKAQIKMELVCGRLRVQALEGAEATLRPDDDSVRKQHKKLGATRCLF